MNGGNTRDYEAFPRIKDDIGENPARWLDREILGDDDRERVVRTLIDGIDKLERVRAWIAVERRLAVRDGRDPRQGIIQGLQEREAHLEDVGDRWDRLDEPAERVPSVASCIEHDRPDGYTSERAFGPLRERYPHAFDDEDLLDPDTALTGCRVVADGGDDQAQQPTDDSTGESR